MIKTYFLGSFVCPCCNFGGYESWEALKLHVKWVHKFNASGGIDDADVCEDLIAANDGAGNYFLVINFDIFIGREKNLTFYILNYFLVADASSKRSTKKAYCVTCGRVK